MLKALLLTATSFVAATPPPLIYVSGLTASEIYVDINKVDGCLFNLKNVKIWPIEASTFLLGTKCLANVFNVIYDKDTGEFKDGPGVTSYGSIGFPMLDGLTFADNLRKDLAPYGYKEGETLFGAAFDWRRPDSGLEEYYGKVQALVEEVFTNTSSKVSFVAPSYGPQVVLGFLQRMTPAWKDQYIDWFIAESPTWNGNVDDLTVLISGYPGAEALASIAREFPSVFWLTPRPGDSKFDFGKEEVLVTTPSKQYTAYDFPELFTDMGYAFRLPMYESILQNSSTNDAFAAPGVNTLVTYGTGVDTTGSITYSEDFTGDPAQVVKLASVTNATEKGDGIVPVRSATRSMMWAAAQEKAGKTLLHKEFKNQYHASCLTAGGTNDNCFAEVIALLINGTMPQGARRG